MKDKPEKGANLKEFHKDIYFYIYKFALQRQIQEENQEKLYKNTHSNKNI